MLLPRHFSMKFKYSTRASITVSIADMEIPEKKYELIHEAEKEVVKIDRQFKRGFITNDERYRLTVQQWEKSINDGYANAFSAIFDSNLTSIITGVILLFFGTGPIKGFATSTPRLSGPS